MKTLSRIILGVVAIKMIEAAVDKLFDKARNRIIGPRPSDLVFYYYLFSRELSIPGVFESASMDEKARPDSQILDSLLNNIENYMNSYRAATKAQVVQVVNASLQEALLSKKKVNLKKVLDKELDVVWKKATVDMTRLADTEIQNAKNIGHLDGIVKVSAIYEIEDPVVYKTVVRDDDCCSTCKRLHVMEDGVTPRLWYLSEMKHGYGKSDDTVPTVGSQHCHCRCEISTCLPGFGPDKNGNIEFKHHGYDAIKEQRR